MELEWIYRPVADDLLRVDNALKGQHVSISGRSPMVTGVMEHMAKFPGKRLRPAMALLSYRCASEGKRPGEELIYFAAAMELIHTASLVHDDIVDKEEERRGVKSIYSKFGSHIAALAGDLLYIRAFSLLIGRIDPAMLALVTNCVERMCYGEITELAGTKTFEDHIKIIEHKTAFFTSICCRIAGMLSGAGVAGADKLGEFGLNFGIAYQLRDDKMDKDTAFTGIVEKTGIIKKYTDKAAASMNGFSESEYKGSLLCLAGAINAA